MAINKGGGIFAKNPKNTPPNPYFFSRLRRDFHFSTSFLGFSDIFLHFLFYKVFNQSNQITYILSNWLQHKTKIDIVKRSKTETVG